MESQQMPGSGGPRIRASDGEREQVAQILRAAMGEGRLTLDEGEERLIQVYRAVYRDDLAKLTADLPGDGRQALAELPEARIAAEREQRRRTAIVAAAVVAAVVLIGVWAATGAHFFLPGFLFFFILIRPFTRGHWRR